MSAMDNKPFPRAALIGAGLLLGLNLVAVAAIQLSKIGGPDAKFAAWTGTSPLQTRALRFEQDQVFDAGSGARITSLRDNDGFVRTVLSSLAFERTRRAMPAHPVYTLTHWSDGRWSLEDRETRTRINLGAFGRDNKSVFYRFMAGDKA